MFGNNNGFGFDLGALLGNMAGNNNGSGMWGEGIWAVIILAILFGWGGYGGGIFGGGRGGQGTNDVESAVQRGFDTQSIVSKLDGISNGVCSLGYDQLNQMNGLGTTVMQTGTSILNAIQNNAIAALQSNNALQALLQSCCCDLKSLFAQADYNRATDTCAITTAIDRVGDRIVANDNNNFRALYDQQVALQMDALRQQNNNLQRQINTCETRDMINAGNNYVINKLNPTPGPAYIVQNPNGCQCNNGWNNWGWGWNNGFGFYG